MATGQIITQESIAPSAIKQRHLVASPTQKGDLYYGGDGNSFTNLSIGTTGQVLKVNNGVPVWGANGTTGPTGPTGSTGPTGTKGATGPTGPSSVVTTYTELNAGSVTATGATFIDVLSLTTATTVTSNFRVIAVFSMNTGGVAGDVAGIRLVINSVNQVTFLPVFESHQTGSGTELVATITGGVDSISSGSIVCKSQIQLNAGTGPVVARNARCTLMVTAISS